MEQFKPKPELNMQIFFTKDLANPLIEAKENYILKTINYWIPFDKLTEFFFAKGKFLY